MTSTPPHILGGKLSRQRQYGHQKAEQYVTKNRASQSISTRPRSCLRSESSLRLQTRGINVGSMAAGLVTAVCFCSFLLSALCFSIAGTHTISSMVRRLLYLTGIWRKQREICRNASDNSCCRFSIRGHHQSLGTRGLRQGNYLGGRVRCHGARRLYRLFKKHKKIREMRSQPRKAADVEEFGNYSLFKSAYPK